jgi:hypothetical protein
VKTSKIFSLPADTVTALCERAAAVGASQSALVDLFVRRGLATITEDKLQAWARAQRTQRAAVVASRLKGSEQSALEALPVGDYLPFHETRAISGQGEAVHWRALKGLEARGLAEMQVPDKPVHVDPRTKRPVTSLWRKKVTT